MNINVYINKHYRGNASRFARETGFSYCQVKYMKRTDCIVIDGVVYRPMHTMEESC